MVGTPTWKEATWFLLHKCLLRAEKPHGLQLACFCPRMLSRQSWWTAFGEGEDWLKSFWAEELSRKPRLMTGYWKKKQQLPPHHKMSCSFSLHFQQINNEKMKICKNQSLLLSEPDLGPYVVLNCQQLPYASYQSGSPRKAGKL